MGLIVDFSPQVMRFHRLIVCFFLAFILPAHAIISLNVGTTNNSRDGFTLRQSMQIIESNFVSQAASISAVSGSTLPGTIAELLALDPSLYLTNIYVAGYYVAGDGGGGNFKGNASSTATTNYGTVFKAPAFAGRWLRQDKGALNPLWFGAKDDGTTDGTTQLQNMIYTAELTTNAIHFPTTANGFVWSSLKLTNSVGLDISGDSTGVILKYDAATLIYPANPFYYGIFVGQNAHRTKIHGFSFTRQSTGFPTSSANTTSGPLFGIWLGLVDDSEIYNVSMDLPDLCGIFVGGALRARIHDITLNNCVFASGISFYGSLLFGSGPNAANSDCYARSTYDMTVTDFTVNNGVNYKKAFFLSGDQNFVANRVKIRNFSSVNGSHALMAYIGDVGITESTTNSWSTNWTGTILDCEVSGTFTSAITIRGDQQQSSIAYLGAAAINVDDIRSNIRVSGSKINGTGNAFYLYTARQAQIVDNKNVQVTGAILLNYGDSTGYHFDRNKCLSTLGGVALANYGCISFGGTAFGNTGETLEFWFEDNEITDGISSEWFFRSNLNNPIRKAHINDNKWFFRGQGTGDFGTPTFFSISSATNANIELNRNWFYATNAMDGRQLGDIAGQGYLTFNDNHYVAQTNAVLSLRGPVIGLSSNTVATGNSMGYLRVRSTGVAIVANNQLTADYNGSVLQGDYINNLTLAGNQITNTATSSSYAINFDSVTNGVLSANSVSMTGSGGPFIATTIGTWINGGNSFVNSGGGASGPLTSGAATISAGLDKWLTSDGGIQLNSGIVQTYNTKPFRALGTAPGATAIEYVDVFANVSAGNIINSTASGGATYRDLRLQVGGTNAITIRAASPAGGPRVQIGNASTETGLLNVSGDVNLTEVASTLHAPLGIFSTNVTGGSVTATTNINVGKTAVFSSTAGDPSPLPNSGIWYNGSLNKMRKAENGVASDMSVSGAGEANTASNVGSGGVGVFAAKSSVDLQFNSLVAGTGITVVSNANLITITATGGGGSTPTGTGFTHITSGSQDGASKKVDLTASADVTVPGTGTEVIYRNGSGALTGTALIDVATGDTIRTPKLAVNITAASSRLHVAETTSAAKAAEFHWTNNAAYVEATSSTWNAGDLANDSTSADVAAGIAVKIAGQRIGAVVGKRTGTSGDKGSMIFLTGNGSAFAEGFRIDDSQVGSFTNSVVSPKFQLASPTGPTITSGTGSPESVVTAVVGSIFLRTDGSTGTTQYRKETGSGNTGWIAAAGGGSGTVTSVAASVPSFLSISGSPVTTSGTLAISYSGTALPIANGGTASTTAAAAFDALSPNTTQGDLTVRGASSNQRLALGTANQILGVNNGATAHEYKTLTAGTGITITPTAGVLTVTRNTVSLTADVSGTLPVANGGTGIATATAHGVVMGEGTSAMAVSAAGTSGQAFLSGGASADGAYGALSLAGAAVTGVLPAANVTPFGSSLDFGYNNAGTGAGGNLKQEAAGVVSLRNSTTAQYFDIYKTYTDASNYERLRIGWNSGSSVLEIAQSVLGTGTLRNMSLNAGTSASITYNGGAHYFNINGTGLYSVDATGIYPAQDNSRVLGTSRSAGRYSQVFTAKNGVLSGAVGTSTADAAVANTTTETTLLGTVLGTYTIEASQINLAGKTVRVRVRGVVSDTLTPTLNIKFKIGGTTIVSTGAQTMVTSLANNSFECVVDLVTRTTGSSGTIMANGMFNYNTPAFALVSEPMVITSTATVNLTTTQVIDVTATWSAASASNTITGQTVTVEILN